MLRSVYTTIAVKVCMLVCMLALAGCANQAETVPTSAEAAAESAEDSGTDSIGGPSDAADNAAAGESSDAAHTGSADGASAGSSVNSEAGDGTAAESADPSSAPATAPPVLQPVDYLQPPPLVYTPPAPPVVAHGIYVTANQAGIPNYLTNLIAVCKESGMNAMVIDIRTENEITMKNWIDFADEWGVAKNFIPDVTSVMAALEEAEIYTIARMVTFLDGYTVDYRPELYIHNQDGTVWMGPVHNGSKRYPWLNPYNRDTWDYVLTYAKAAAELGFDEIQFDYVRFAASKSLETVDFGDTRGLSRTEIIQEFLAYAVEELHPYGVKVSADVYGTIINSDLDASIVGQDYAALAQILDIICPMIYPSHFAGGTYGVDHPDTEPYKIIYNVLLKSAERLSGIPEDVPVAVVRPWLQDFTLTYLKPHLNYGPAEREAQIKAVYDAGLTEWLLWDPANRYEAEGIFFKE